MKEWIINALDTKPKEDGLTDVVINVQWTRTATTIFEDKEYKSYTNGNMSCSTPSSTDFTAYPDLTYEQVCGWLDAGLDVENIDLNLDLKLEFQINPPIVNLPLPFNNPTI
jgi:hypothetical protein